MSAKRTAYECGYSYGRNAGYARPEEPYGHKHDLADAEPAQVLYAQGYRVGYADGQEAARAAMRSRREWDDAQRIRYETLGLEHLAACDYDEDAALRAD